MYLGSDFQRADCWHLHLQYSCGGIKKNTRNKKEKKDKERNLSDFLHSNITIDGCECVFYIELQLGTTGGLARYRPFIIYISDS